MCIKPFVLAGTLAVVQNIQAADIVLTFEGLANDEPVSTFYDGGFGGLGSGPGPDFGVTFSSDALAVIDRDAGGTGGFSGEPSESTVLYSRSDTMMMQVASGFEGGLSFWYAMPTPDAVGFISVLDEFGTTLHTEFLFPTPEGPGDPTGSALLQPAGFSFSGIATSIVLGGPPEDIVFDDIAFSSRVPIPRVPETASAYSTLFAGFMLLLGSVFLRTAPANYFSKARAGAPRLEA